MTSSIELWDAGRSSRTILGLIQPLLDRLGDIGTSAPVEIDRRIGLIPGDLGLSLFEDRLAETWGRCFDDNAANASDAFRVTTAFYRIMEHAARQRGADLVLIDVGPNLGAINRAALVSADHVVIPLAADLFSLQGLRNLGPTLRSWRMVGRIARRTEVADSPSSSSPSPRGRCIRPVMSSCSPRSGRIIPSPLIAAGSRGSPRSITRRSWNAARGRGGSNPDPMALATLKNYRSLAPMAQEARKPMFALKPADGAIGGHAAAVQASHRAFRELAERIADACHFPIPSRRIARRQESVT